MIFQRERALFLASFLLLALSLLPESYAAPAISNLAAGEANLWLGEGASISLGCTQDANSSANIIRVYSVISGPGIILPEMNFSASGSAYSLSVPQSYLDRAGIFNTTVFCIDSAGENASESVAFSVSNISSEVKSAATPLYSGDVAEIGYLVKKDGIALVSGVSFEAAIDGQSISLLQAPAFDTTKGWMLKFSTSSLAAGNHSFSVSAKYGRASTAGSAKIEIRPSAEFSVLNIDRTEVQSGNEIIASVKATDRGSPVAITAAQISARVDSAEAKISGISQAASGIYDVKIVAPPFASGTRRLAISFNYGNFSASYAKNITYVVPVSGKIAGADGKGVPAQILFKSSALEKSLNADNTGAYSAYLPPGAYNITVSHDGSMFGVDDASIDGFDDSIKYQYISNLDIAGIKEAGIYVYEVALDYSAAHIRMKYDEGKVSDESKLKVYECSNWNSGRRECVSGWREIPASIDMIKNAAKADVPVLHAYAIGTEDTVGAEANLDKAEYILGEKMKLAGIVRDSGASAVAGANITASIEGVAGAASAVSGAGGVFTLELAAPSSEGKFALLIRAEKPPYVFSERRIEFGVAKSRSISIVAPDTIRLRPAESAAAEFTIANLGQADFSDLKVAIKGVPESYYTISQATVDSLKSGEEKTVSVNFHIPSDAAKATLGGTIEISGGYSASKGFGLTISSQQESTSAAQANATASKSSADSASSGGGFEMPTGLASLAAMPVSAGDIYNLALFAVASFSLALLLRRLRLSGYSLKKPENSARNMMFEIKKRVVEPERASNKRKQAKGYVSYANRW